MKKKIKLNESVEFAVWLRDNFSPFKKDGDKIDLNDWLPKNQWRRDFTDDIFEVGDLYEEFKNKHS